VVLCGPIKPSTNEAGEATELLNPVAGAVGFGANQSSFNRAGVGSIEPGNRSIRARLARGPE
jgi:hypothetical protein